MVVQTFFCYFKFEVFLKNIGMKNYINTYHKLLGVFLGSLVNVSYLRPRSDENDYRTKTVNNQQTGTRSMNWRVTGLSE